MDKEIAPNIRRVLLKIELFSDKVNEDFMSLESAILKLSITSFYDGRDLDLIPEFSFAEFQTIVFAVITSLGFTVLEWTERGITPNFHSVLVMKANHSILILGHGTYPIIAFSEPLTRNTYQLHFVDCKSIAQVITRYFPQAIVATSEELKQRLTPAKLTQLGIAELNQIQYW